MARLGVSEKKKSPRATELSELKKEVQRLTEQLESRDREQTATSEILRLIATLSMDIQSVLDTIAENAARVCDSYDAVIRLVGRNILRMAAHHGPTEPGDAPFTRGNPAGRAVIDRTTIHVHDITAKFEMEFPESRPLQQRSGARTILATPLLREGVPIGVIVIRRTEVRPFTDKQIALLKTFADQAVIAIENVRLFKELQSRNRDLIEALEQQTATGEVLRVIASSPTDVQPVLDTLIANAVKLSGATKGHVRQLDGEFFRVVAHYGETPEEVALLQSRPGRVGVQTSTNRAFSERKAIQIADATAERGPSSIAAQHGARTMLSIPLLREGTAIGVIVIWRDVVEPFTERQVALVETFADQAVIAIENVRLFQELKESLEQQTATSEILGVIASSPTDIQPVLDAVAATAARLCDARDVLIDRVNGDFLEHVAAYGPMPTAESRRPLSRGTPAGKAIIERQTIHIHDVVPLLDTEYPEAKARQQVTGTRTALVVPLLREGVAIGTIQIRRPEVRPFSEKQIALLKTFADQAVIAIENVRLFRELGERNAELREALEHQTATAEVLGIISRSPTDVQPVLDAIVEIAARICGIDDVLLRLHEGNTTVPRAHFGSIPIPADEIDVDRPTPRWVREHGTLHIPDVREQKVFFVSPEVPVRTFLAVALRLQGEFIGYLGARRIEVRPFTPVQIKLLETFADQAVIAIENVRLFNELKEALEQQTATSEILGVIASSPTDIQPVLDAVAKNAARLCEATDAQIRLVEGEETRLAASFGTLPAPEFRPVNPRTPSGRAILTRDTVHIHDLQEVKNEFPESEGLRRGLRTFLSEPMLREGTAIGAINIRRMEVRPFSDKHIKLLKTFASQAVIAIENVRLFRELGERNAELREALEHQTATSEVLGIISRSPTDVQPVLDAIVESAARVCGIDDVVLRLVERNAMVVRAHIGSIPIGRIEISIDEPQNRWIRKHGTLHIPDVREQKDFPIFGAVARTYLVVPLRQQGELIGTLNARRTEVRPFTPSQIKLLETFADQAVIAIENVRLFKELQERTRELVESVEEMKALGEVGQAVSSALILRPCLQRLCRGRSICRGPTAV